MGSGEVQRQLPGKPEEIDGQIINFADNIFVDKDGWLGDDVTYWMPDEFPPLPTPEEMSKDLHHPRDMITGELDYEKETK